MNKAHSIFMHIRAGSPIRTLCFSGSLAGQSRLVLISNDSAVDCGIMLPIGTKSVLPDTGDQVAERIFKSYAVHGKHVTTLRQSVSTLKYRAISRR